MWIKYFFADKPFVHLWKVKELGILLHHDCYKAAGSVYNQPEMSNMGGGKTYLHQLGTMDQDVWCLTSLSAIFQLEQGAIMAVIVW